MSKERLQQILDEYKAPYKVSQESDTRLKVRVNNWVFVEFNTKTNGIYQHSPYDEAPFNMQREINTALAKYIVQEEELRSGRFYLRMKKPMLKSIVNYLNYFPTTKKFQISSEIETSAIKTQFTESDIEQLKEEIDGFDELLELFEKEYVED